MISIEIENIKSLKKFSISLPFKKGLYAIVGENGTGKSTVFSCLSKLVYRDALRRYFRSDGDSMSRLVFKYGDIENVWVKKPNWRRDDRSESEILLDGFYEGSLIFGSRFVDAHSSKLGKSYKVKDGDLVPASDFVKKSLGNILRDDEDQYADLMKIRTKKRASELGFNGMPYFIKRNGKWVSQLFMSSGELLLIGLLSLMEARVELKKRKGIESLVSLMLIDEIELALHPSAQQRMARFLDKISRVNNFCIYFATHSVQIINSVEADKIFYLKRTIDGSVSVVNPCYPAYATRSLYTNDGFDLLILVEDDLAKYIMEKIIREKRVSTSRMVKVLACGGWEKTLELHLEMARSGILGSGCDIVSVLDGDIESDYWNKYPSKTKESTLKKLFLPIHSVEKFLKMKLVDDPCEVFAQEFGDYFFVTRSIEDIVHDYLSNPKTKEDRSGKAFFRIVSACAEDEGFTRERFKVEVCGYLTKHAELDTLSEKLVSVV